MSSDDLDAEEWIDIQQKEIDNAAEDLSDRRGHITGRVRDGLLDGDGVKHHENKRIEAYLQGYADALEFASRRVGRIDNRVKYAIAAVRREDGEDGEADE
jgi:hypothetical protein